MGFCSSKNNGRLSPSLEEKVLGIFRRIDVNGSKTIDREETLKFWKQNFAKLNTEALFKAVDKDKNGNISEDEWLQFWQIVKKSGHSEQEINDELENLMNGEAWAHFDKVPDDINKVK